MNVKEAIDKLNTMDQSSFLEDCRTKNIKGNPLNCRNCLIANWIKNESQCGQTIKVYSYGAVKSEVFSEWYTLNFHFQSIIKAFDSGLLREFVEPYQ